MTRPFKEKKLVIASHNAGKIAEIRDLLAPFSVEIVSVSEFNLPEPDETEDTFAGNARIKAHFAAKNTGLPALADDSGICVDALNGAPGVYTANWAETETGRDFEMAMQKVWNKVQESNTLEPFTAHFNATLCLAWPDGHDEIFEGQAKGTLTWPMRGKNGFGFDPMFVPLDHKQTFGEMQPAEKKRLSHRTKAFKMLVENCFDT